MSAKVFFVSFIISWIVGLYLTKNTTLIIRLLFGKEFILTNKNIYTTILILTTIILPVYIITVMLFFDHISENIFYSGSMLFFSVLAGLIGGLIRLIQRE